MDFALPEELKQLQLLARKFIKEELLPIEREVEEKDEFPDALRRRLRKKAVDIGLWNYYTPEKYGGGGLGALALAVVCEELGAVSIAVGQQGGVIGAGRESFLLHGNERQREKYLIPYVNGDKEFYIGLTEPDAGSDTSGLRTKAVKDGDKYILNGNKTFITMAERSDFGIVFAVTDPTKAKKGRITCFLVDKDAPGFSISRKLSLLGRRGLDTCELSFEDCLVPGENILGGLGNGLRIALSGLMEDRLLIASGCIGVAQRAYNMAADYAKQRITFGQPLAQRQMIQSMLVDTAMEIYAARMMLYNAAWEHDQGMVAKVKIAMVKNFASRLAGHAVDMAIQVHGGYGYTKDLPLEMLYRDIRAARIGGGATETLHAWIASQLLDIPFG